ncbi:MAG: EAL domain-containing protein [Acidimicrobiales bacterium]|jgi:PAS domain S-box-containing protein
MQEPAGKLDDGLMGRLGLGMLDCAPEAVRRVLIIGGDLSAANIERHLRTDHYDVRAIVVNDEPSLTEAVGSFLPQVLLTDCDLAHLGGEQMVRTLKRLFPALPVIVLTGTLDDGDAARLCEIGACDYILKDRPARLGFAVESAIAAAQDRVDARALESERARFAKEIESSQTRFSSLVEHSSDLILLVDSTGLVVYVGPSVKSLLGYDADSLVGTMGFDHVHPDDLDEMVAAFTEAVSTPGTRPPVTVRIRHASGEWRWFRAVANSLLQDPTVHGMVVNAHDVTPEKLASDSLTRSEALLRKAESLTHVGHWELDSASGRLEWLADEMFTIHGITPSEWGASLSALMSLVYIEDRSRVSRALEQTLKEGTAEVEHRIVRPDGEVRHVRKHTEAVDAAAGGKRIVGTCQDITDQKVAEQEIERSREFLAAITDNMAEGMMVEDGEGALTFVNAAAERLLGWKAADLMGKRGHRIIHFMRADGEPLSEDECPIRSALGRGESVHVDHDNFIRRDGSSFPVSYSASPLQTDEFRGSVVVFDDISERAAEELRIERELEKLSWVGRIRDALDQHRFVLFAQPVLDLSTKLVVQHELLLRMISPSGEIVLPGRFLPTAEEFGLISEIDRWVVGEAARLAAEGHAVEFNLSAKSVLDPNMLDVVSEALASHGARAELLVCEITETAIMSDIAAAEVFVRGLNDLGCQVALDDFGAGYGGFAYLKRLPVSYLKIDQEFVRDLAQEASSRHVVSAVVSLARAFSLVTVGEAAEDEVTLELLEQLGVDRAQGFVIARPCPLEEVFVPTNA